MTEPTRTDIIRAYEALDDICNLVIMGRGYPANEYRNLILAALPPRPQPTMAEIEWDDDQYFLAEVKTESGMTAVMLHCVSDTQILCLHKEYGTYRAYNLASDQLIPTGKRYTLTEVQDD